MMIKGKSLKIILAIERPGPGGTERQVTMLAKNLKQQGHTVSVLMTNYSHHSLEDEHGHYSKELSNMGVPVRYAKGISDSDLTGLSPKAESLEPFKIHLGYTPPLYRKHVSEFVAEFLKERPDVVHCWLDAANIFAGLAAKIVGIPRTIVSLRGVAPYQFEQHYFRGVKEGYKILQKDPRVKFIANSSLTARSYANWLRIDSNTIGIVHDGIVGRSDLSDTKEKRSYKRKLGIKENALVLTSAFTFAPGRRPFVFGNLTLEALKKYPELHLIIIGKGPLKKDFREMFHQKGVLERTLFLESTKDTDMVFQISDIFLSTATYEGISNAVMEALASECATIVSGTRDIEELLDSGNAGVLVEPNDKSSTRRELFRLIKNKPLRESLSRKGKSHVEKKFSVQRMASATEEVYSSLQGPPLLQKRKRILGDFGFLIDKIATIFFDTRIIRRIMLSPLGTFFWNLGLPPIEKSHPNNIYNLISRFNPEPPLTTDKKPPKVLMLIGSLGPGGSERQATKLGLELKNRGIDIEFLTTSDLAGLAGHHHSVLNQASIPAHSLIRDGVPSPEDCRDLYYFKEIGKLPPSLFPSYQIAAKLNIIQPDIVHCWLDQTNLWGAIASILHGSPQVILSTRSVNPTHLHKKNAWMKFWYKRLLQNENIIAVNNSRAGAKDYAKWVGTAEDRFEVIENGIELPKADFRHSEAKKIAIKGELGLEQNSELVLGVMRLTEEKRPELFLDACSIILKRRPNAKAILVGDGPLNKKLGKKLKGLGVGDRFRMLGISERVIDIMKCCDVLMLTSRQEGSPNVLIEAQSVGCPVLTTSAGGATEAINDGITGFVVSDRPKEIAQKACDILSDDSLKQSLGNAGKLFVREKFQMDNMVKKTLKLYDRALNKSLTS